MSGNKAGGMKAAKKNKERYGANFYSIIGRKGGMAGRGCGGFASNPELAREAGRKGGRISRRGGLSPAVTILDPNADKIAEMLQAGLSIPQIAEKLKVSAATLRKWAKKSLPYYGDR